jgi:hypothetical protein
LERFWVLAGRLAADLGRLNTLRGNGAPADITRPD